MFSYIGDLSHVFCVLPNAIPTPKNCVNSNFITHISSSSSVATSSGAAYFSKDVATPQQLSARF